MQTLKLPTILAYIFTGLLIGSISVLGQDYFTDEVGLEALSKIGITLLLFILGLEMKVGELRSVGKVALITGIGQIVFTSLIGYGLALLLGYESRESLYIAIALTFSSTIVIVKLLSDKHDLNSLYGKISIGFLLIQDFVAILALLLLNGLAAGESVSIVTIIVMLAKAALVFAIVIFLSQKILPTIIHSISHSLELLFSFSLAWAFGVALLVSSDAIGLSIEIGGFLAGLALANAVESLQIVSKIRTLRDFFIIIFFVHLGLSLHLDNISESIGPAIFFSLFVLIGNPIIVLFLLTGLRFKAKTAFMSGLTVAQISEFSLIVIFLGKDLGHVTEQTASMITLVGIFTFAISSYMIMNSDLIYKYIHHHLKHFERKSVNEQAPQLKEMNKHVVVIGIDQMGTAILKEYKNKKDEIVAVDFNPDVVNRLKEDGYNVVFGDITESDVMGEANLGSAKTIISTLPTLEDNLILIQSIKRNHPEVQIIVNAERKEYRKALLEAGADMVIAPFELAGQMLSRLVAHDELEIRD
ncbi:cation:proton antiporter [Candidatus Dojkabacteria bacterium]|uniref:Cation:proton antiporter n=1 Tax=Candidatus Dojkabacteria bacterium TaxID=2099670 RepID=A0A955L0H9_9BACT|nr:cation:proton antiporter [Candidatus Dojkabacteria bacterium]